MTKKWHISRQDGNAISRQDGNAIARQDGNGTQWYWQGMESFKHIYFAST